MSDQEESEALRAENAALRTENTTLRETVRRLEERLAELERTKTPPPPWVTPDHPTTPEGEGRPRKQRGGAERGTAAQHTDADRTPCI